MATTKLTLNGKAWRTDADPDMPLLWALRDVAGLTGTKFGCGMAQCGACTVHVDGEPTRACVTPLSAVDGRRVTTIEGAPAAAGKVGKAAAAVQAAWRELNVVQCGYCQSGQIMSASALLAANARPTDADIDAAMNGNICRCATYPRIRAAIHEAARKMEG
jgi:isoquinoline 1-oxidoreductase alpha subunit